MPKMKTKKSVAKRFKVKKSGKVKYKQANLRHMLALESRNRKRKLRSKSHLITRDALKVKSVLPYG